jgi:hypothetical protein
VDGRGAGDLPGDLQDVGRPGAGDAVRHRPADGDPRRAGSRPRSDLERRPALAPRQRAVFVRLATCSTATATTSCRR